MRNDGYISYKATENDRFDKLTTESKCRLTFNLLYINMKLLKDALLRTDDENDSKTLQRAIGAMMNAYGVIVKELVEIQEEELKKLRFSELSDEELVQIMKKRNENNG